MARHNSRERALFEDLSEKNRLAAEFHRLSHRVRGWKERTAKKRGKRWQKQYGIAIHRAEERIADLRDELLARNEDLRARIIEEQNISEAEVGEFETQYRKEVEELAKAHEALSDANETLEANIAKARNAEKADAILSSLRHKNWNAARDVRREAGEVRKAAKEIESEVQDAATFKYELRRIVAELESLRD